MQTISRSETRRLIDEGVPVVEVLDADHFEDFHLPNAINVPLGEDFDERIQDAVPDKSQKVVVYCYDTDCKAAPKAAERMDALGYQNVLEYEAGKVDWKAAGLAVE